MDIKKFSTEFFQTIFSIAKIILLSKYFVGIKSHKTGKDECVILANGPSLNFDVTNNSDFIINKSKFCVNFFGLSDLFEKIKPEYYILAAPEFWLQKTSEYFNDQKEKLTEALITKTEWKLKLFIPFQAKNSAFCQSISQNKNIEIIYFNNTPVEGRQSIINSLFKANLGMPRPHNVLVPSIFLALNLGFKKIFLFGVDHSWHEEIRVDSKNKVTVNHEHFYDKQKIILPMYKLDGEEYFIHDIFRKLHLAFKGYFVLHAYSEKIGAKIFNAGSKSYIDAFEKIDVR